MATPDLLIRAITRDVARKFRCFGAGSPTDTSNPIAAALAEQPTAFAAGVDVADVVRFVLERAAAPDGGRS
jgi:hypothetical protein